MTIRQADHLPMTGRQMAKATLEVDVSLTEMPQFSRLVDFAIAVSDLAHDRDDEQLRGLVAECHEDLAAMTRNGTR